MPEMAAARSAQGVLASLLLRAAAHTPYPMIPAAISTTTPATAIGPQLRPPATLTGVTGLRPLPPPPLPAGRLPPGRADFVGGLPWPVVLPTLTVDGTLSGPGVLMLIVPRQLLERGKLVARERKGRGPVSRPRHAAERQSLPG